MAKRDEPERGDPVPHGPVDPDFWASKTQRPRILWLLKEPNTGEDPTDSDWNLAEQLRTRAENKALGGWHPTYGLVAKTAWALTELDQGEALPKNLRLGPKHCHSLRGIAVVNIDPRAGARKRSDEVHVTSVARKREPEILEEILGYKPDLVIGGNTIHMFRRDGDLYLPPPRSDPLDEPFPSQCLHGIVWINAYHPAVRRTNIEPGDYIEKVRKAWFEHKR